LGREPIIDAARDLAETITKTLAVSELDDKFPDGLMDIAAKSPTIIEGDDFVYLKNALLDLTTKTAAQLESDDTRPTMSDFM
jgi:hypothetical protein